MNFPMVVGPYRLWRPNQDDTVGCYQIRPESSYAIWLVANDWEQGGFWPMIFDFDEACWKALTVNPLTSFASARSVLEGYRKRHGLEPEELA